MKHNKDYYDVKFCKCGSPLVSVREVTFGVCDECEERKRSKK